MGSLMTEGTEDTALENLLEPGTPESVVKMYQGLAQEAETRSFDLLEEDVVVLDTETTGLSFRDDELIEVAAARLSGREVVERFQSFVKPKKPIPPEIQELTGITMADVMDAPRAPEVIASLAEFVGGAPVIAHNATFDRTFVEKVKGGTEVSDLWIDSLALSRIALPRLKSHRLQDMAEAFHCDAVSHRAMDDVDALAGMWRIILLGLSHLPQSLLALLAETHEEVEWAYRPIFSHLAQEAGKEPFSLVAERKKLLGGLSLHVHGDARELGHDQGSPKASAIEDAFGPDGIVSTMYEAFEPRSAQAAMAEEVRRALDQSTFRAIEAGTGVGKSMAYLVPMALFAQRNDVTCAVATKTNALTDQLISHELPALAKVLPKGLSFTSLKGYDHYACLRKVETALREPLPLDRVASHGRSKATVVADMLTALAVILASACQTPEGDIDALGIRWRSVPRNLVTTTPRECLRQKCPYFPDQCFVHGARKRAAAADIVVTNHSLLLRNVDAEGRIMPPVRHWVVDEAHSFEDEARRQWAREVSAEQARTAFEALGDSHNGAIHTLITQAASSEAATPVLGLLTKASSALARAQVLSADFFDKVYGLAQREGNGSGYDQVTIWVDDHLRGAPLWKEMAEVGQELSRALEEAVKLLQEANSKAQETMENPTTTLEDPTRTLSAFQEALALILLGQDQSYVYSVDASLAKSRRGSERLVAEKLDVGQELADRWYPEADSVIYTSATMAVGEGFEHFEQAVGLDLLPTGMVKTLKLESGYDYDDQMAVVVAQDLPEPGRPGYVEKLTDMLFEVHRAMGGSVLTLFTNRREMESVYRALEPRLDDIGLDLLIQDRNSNPRRLRERFMAHESTSLFGLKSFWEGFDAAGDTLKCVVIPRLPFANPNEPLSREREARDRRAWWRYSLPEAVLAVKQAAGRLIRSSTDTGVLVLADSRVVTKRYGAQFVASVPSRNVSRLSWDRIGPFIELWKKSH